MRRQRGVCHDMGLIARHHAVSHRACQSKHAYRSMSTICQHCVRVRVRVAASLHDMVLAANKSTFLCVLYTIAWYAYIDMM